MYIFQFPTFNDEMKNEISYIFRSVLSEYHTYTLSYTNAHAQIDIRRRLHYITKPWSHNGPSDIWGQHKFSAKLNNFGANCSQLD